MFLPCYDPVMSSHAVSQLLRTLNKVPIKYCELLDFSKLCNRHMLYTVLTPTIPRIFVVCSTVPNIQCSILKAGVIHVYVATWCIGLKLRSPALHSNLYLETQYPAVTKGMPWIKQCHIPPCSLPQHTYAYYPAVVQPLLQQEY
jgi:hypothetical protein